MTSDWNDIMHSVPREFATSKKNSIIATTDGSNLILLPTEICESILDELAESPETLRACALVCHWFAQRAQKLLFSCICLRRPTRVFDPVLGFESYVLPSNGFLKTISSSPHLAAYVKSLTISDAESFKCHHTYREDRSWLRSSSENPVHEILPLLANLEELGIAGNARESLNFLAWESELHIAILDHFSSDRLVTIRLGNIDEVPFSLFGLTPRLETLRLEWVSLVSYLDHTHTTVVQEYMKRKARHPPARLKHLSLTLSYVKEWCTFYTWLASHLDITQIKSLELHISFFDEEREVAEEGLQAVLALLNGCSATLETLRLFMPELEDLINSQYIPSPFEFDARAMSALRNLHLTSWVRYVDHLEFLSPRWGTPSAAALPGMALRNLTSIISKTFSSDPPHTQLESLTIHLIVHDYAGKKSVVENIGWEAFAGVIEELAAVGRMSSSSESRREVIEVDLRPMMGWETTLGQVYSRPMWETTLEIVRDAVPLGATSVTLIASLQAGSDDIAESSLEKKLGWLREKGVGFKIHSAAQ